MKKSFSMLITLSFLIFGAYAQDTQTVKAQAENPNAPEISFDKTVHDYGTIFVGGDGHCEYEFTNTGKEPLILSSVRSSCGCTIPSWPREPILPGKKETIKVKYDTNRMGPINKSVTVLSNAKNTPIVLRMTGNIIKKTEESAIPEKSIAPGSSPMVK